MSITNGYTTLNKLRHKLLDRLTYTSTTISFDSGTKKISDSAYALRGVQDSDTVQVSGSTNNDGYYTVATGNTPGYFVVSESLTTEAAGDTVTITVMQDQMDDWVLESVIEAVSRSIDTKCKRRFYTTDSDETRYFTARWNDILYPGDIVSITTLAGDTSGDGTYNETWATTDYHLEPFNASLDSEPYTKIQIATLGTKLFPVGIHKGVKIIGKFGWSTAPKQVGEVCLLLAARLFYRKDAVFGIVKGAPELGEVRRIILEDPEVDMLLMGLVDSGKYI